MSAETGSLEGLKPCRVWGIFAGMAAVPRPSKREEKIRAHIHEVAKGLGLKSREESVGNIIVDVPATPGHESAPITVLQGHLDMVAEKNAGTVHDFDRDPIRTVVAKNAAGERIVRAEGTTLGADNGLGVALALAAATDPEVVHGPLELLFTTDEEAGMTGAKALTPDSFKGRRLLNLDSEEDDCVYIGCAGGCDTNLTWRLAASAGGAEACRVVVDGLRGGHSGGDIHENRGNAIKLLTRVLSRAPEATLRVGLISGGRVRNAIPREARAVVSGPAGTIAALEVAAATVRVEGIAESYEEGLSIRVETLGASDAGGVASEADTARLLAALAAVPSGVVGMHPKIPKLVQTSNNLSTVMSEVRDGELEIVAGTLTRSSSASCLQTVTDQIAAVGRLSGADVACGNAYPGWEPNVDSPTLATCRRVYESLFGSAPEVAAIHAGLECGIIGERVGNMDMVSFGPRIEGAHSPDECVYIESVAKSWKYLVAVLGELAR